MKISAFKPSMMRFLDSIGCVIITKLFWDKLDAVVFCMISYTVIPSISAYVTISFGSSMYRLIF